MAHRLWGKLKSYVAELEKSIDADFAQKTSEVQKQEEENRVQEIPETQSDADPPPEEEKPIDDNINDESEKMEHQSNHFPTSTTKS